MTDDDNRVRLMGVEEVNFRTGASLDGELTRRGLRTFEIRVIDGPVWVKPDPREGASVLFHALSG